MSIVDYIPTGKASAISREDLAKVTELPDRRVRMLVAAERRRGRIIISESSGRGYYLPDNTEDVTRFIRSMKKRAREIAAIADATERALMKEVGQSTFEGWQQ